MLAIGRTRHRLVQAWEWPAMGATWRLYHSGGVDASGSRSAAAVVAEDEARWSRFRVDSEVALVNRSAGAWVSVSIETQELAECARHWTLETGGVFQPLIGAVLESWGYRSSLAEGEPGVPVSPAPAPLVCPALAVDREAGMVRIPAGTRLDLGGIAKSWSAVRAARALLDDVSDRAVLLDAGGDLIAVRGDHIVEVRHGGEVIDEIVLAEGHGAGTSGHSRRQWLNGDGVSAHHLIDPARGEPGPFTHVTAVAADPVAADVLATTLCVRPSLLESRTEACLVTQGSQRCCTPAWRDICLPT